MSPEEIRSSYYQLAEIVTTFGLGWVADQVDQTVRSGRAVEKPTRIFREAHGEEESPLFADAESEARRTGKPTALMTLEPWPDLDQLLFLIDGVRHAIVRAAEIENEQLRLMRKVAEVEEISFEVDGEVAEGRGAFRLRGIHDSRIEMLAKLLDELEHEARS